MKSVKVCILGDFAVGKTSLVRRFVDEAFSERYLTTVGVKIDTKTVHLQDSGPIKLVLWDVAGADELSALQTSYVRGSAGFILVCDLTRRETLTTATKLKTEVAAQFGPVPWCLLANKSDLAQEREIDDMALTELAEDGWNVHTTSAKTGFNVETAVLALAARLAVESDPSS
ncbi:MAG: Rab family GTPase [Pseudomonadota bacterium]